LPDDRASVDSQAPTTTIEGRSQLSRSGPTRRGVLIGGAAAAVVRPALAAEDFPGIEVNYEDGTRRALLITCHGPDKKVGHLRLPASAFANPDAPSGAGRFVLSRTAEGWLASIRNGSFPGGFDFALEIRIAWKPVGNDGKPTTASLSLGLHKPGLKPIILTTPDLPTLVLDDGATPMGGPLESEQASALAKPLFGDSFDLQDARDVRLAFHREGHWTLAATAGQFTALAEQGVRVALPTLQFAVLTSRTGAAVTKTEGTREALSEAFNLQDRMGEDVRALFTGPGAPPAPEELATKQLVRVLYALALPTELGKDLTLGAGAETKVRLKLEPTVSAGAGASKASFVAWRNSGDGAPICALDADMSLHVERTTKGAAPTIFTKLRGVLWRARISHGAVRLAAALEPQEVKLSLATRFGPFTVSPLPGTAARPDARVRVPAIVAGGIGPKNDRKLTHFAAPLALEHAAIGLGDGVEVFSALMFTQSECLFRLEGTPLSHPWIGPTPPSTEPPQAEGIVHIGALPQTGSPVRLSLSRAMLQVKRPRDLLSLNYRFQDLVLERDGLRWWVVPDRRLAAFVAHRPPKPPDTKAACEDPPPGDHAPSRYDAGRDPRPLMVVEFPPQHIAEQAFFRQLPVEPTLPLPPSGTEAKDDNIPVLEGRGLSPALLKKLADAHRPPTSATLDEMLQDRVAVRTDIQKKQTDNAPTENGKKPYNLFVDAFAKEDPIAPDGRKLPADQQIYIGPAFLDPEATRIARRVARRIEAARDNTDVPAQNTPESRAYQVRELPEVDLSPVDLADQRTAAGLPKNFTGQWPKNPPTIIPGAAAISHSLQLFPTPPPSRKPSTRFAV
jgi:hypothetical protein